MSGWCDHIDPPVSTTTVDGHTYHECDTCGAWIETP